MTQGNELINSCNMKDKVKFVKGDAFDKESFKGIAKQFNIGVVSGLYELFNDTQKFEEMINSIKNMGHLLILYQKVFFQLH